MTRRRWTARLLVGLLLVALASAAEGPRQRQPVEALLWVWIEDEVGEGRCFVFWYFSHVT